MCLGGPVQDTGHGRSYRGWGGSVDRGGGARALVAMRCGPPAAVLADKGAVLIELDVHAVAILSQRVITAQLAVCAQRRLAVGALLIPITGPRKQTTAVRLCYHDNTRRRQLTSSPLQRSGSGSGKKRGTYEGRGRQ